MPENDGRTLALRDGALATAALGAAVWAGSRGGRDLDIALFGYLGATFAATFALSTRASAFWRRPPSAVYATALWSALRDPRRLRAAFGAAGADLVAQRFVARRSRVRWLAHLAVSLGTLASFAIILPLVFGWLHFEAEGQETFRPVFAGLALPPLALDGALAWLVFHALSLAAVAVSIGAATLLALRARGGAIAAKHLAPLVLLLFVAVTGLALPATRDDPTAFAAAARLHELSVVILLVALSCSKLSHVAIRPLQLGSRLVRAPGSPTHACSACGDAFAPAAQLAAVSEILAARGAAFAGHQQRCPCCRRRLLAAAQAALVGARFHPDLVDARPRINRILRISGKAA
jgi:hypothetical protein